MVLFWVQMYYLFYTKFYIKCFESIFYYFLNFYKITQKRIFVFLNRCCALHLCASNKHPVHTGSRRKRNGPISCGVPLATLNLTTHHLQSMKQLFLLVFLSCLSRFLAIGQCPTAPLTLGTQSAVDSFPIRYPGCSILTHDLIVGTTAGGNQTTNINNLAALSQITETKAELLVVANASLLNLTGLHNLKQPERAPSFEIAVKRV